MAGEFDMDAEALALEVVYAETEDPIKASALVVTTLRAARAAAFEEAAEVAYECAERAEEVARDLAAKSETGADETADDLIYAAQEDREIGDRIRALAAREREGT